MGGAWGSLEQPWGSLGGPWGGSVGPCWRSGRSMGSPMGYIETFQAASEIIEKPLVFVVFPATVAPLGDTWASLEALWE